MSDQVTKARKGGRSLLILAIVLAMVFLIGRSVAGFFTEILWYRSVGYSSVFWTRTLVELGMRIAAGVLTAAVAFGSFRVVGRTLSGVQIRRQFGNLEIAERIPKGAITWGTVLVSLLLGLWLAAAFPQSAGLRLLLLFRAPEWGLAVPWLGRDVSFFVFALPVLGGGMILGLSLVFLLMSFSAAGYAATGSLSVRSGRMKMGPLPRKHLAVLGAIFLLFLAGRFWLAPYLLMLDGNSGVQGIFGFADANARVRGYQALALLTLAAAGVMGWSGFRKRLTPLIASGISVVLGGLILIQLYPELVQRFQVEPNELNRETPYIEANLEFTRTGFGLGALQRAEFDYDPEAYPDWGLAAQQFAGLPIWTPGALLTTFHTLDARFPYYDFETVAVDRYPSRNGIIPVAVAVREIDPGGIGDPNWQNLHLRTLYQAGMGAVASAVNNRTPEGRPHMFIAGIPPVSSGDPDGPVALGSSGPEALNLGEASVYFGSRVQNYAIVNPDSILALGGELSDLPRGIRLNGLVRKLALAWRFGDANLLFASEISPESQFVFRRSVVERASAIAPFLRFLGDPYPVVHQGRIVWILEGFTSTRSFPLSTAQDLSGTGPVTYLRNSVKVTVDAVTGDIRFFRMDQEDPLLEAWSRVFPGLLQPFADMPLELQAHIRYSRELLDVQARVLLQYHQDTAPLFHGQQDVWGLPQELAEGTRPVPFVPEYGLYRLPGEEDPEFLLSSVFVPAGRQNLTALLVARCDPDRFGELLLFDIAVEEQVPGPRQVEALVEQDPIISQQFSLWRQGGSQVWTGHLHIIPVGQTLLYLEPIFLAAEADAIPELRRFVVSDGRRVAMEPTLEGAIASLALAGGEEAPVLSPVGDPGEGPSSTTLWPQEALDLLDQAEEHLRSGDWTGFGEALEELRALLGKLSGG
ncbi:MAG: UPF0182 family protein [Longimicrobiales bacterium]|nr:UPF0182 family protein [Longimicrobiales bacterium]